MKEVDCKPPMTVDVVAPRIPMFIAVSAMALSVFALIKVFEFAQRMEAQRD